MRLNSRMPPRTRLLLPLLLLLLLAAATAAFPLASRGSSSRATAAPAPPAPRTPGESADDAAAATTTAPLGTGLRAAMGMLSEGNITRVINTLRDPDNRNYMVAVGMIAAAALCALGYRCIRIWLFLGGFVAIGGAFYVFSPSILQTTTCCGAGTEQNKALISLMLGILGGGLALYILKIGLFMTGSALGLGLALSIETVLSRLGVRPTDGSFATLYVGAALVFGLLALYKEKPVIVGTTALLGAFGFFVGVGYYQSCNFFAVAQLLEHSIERPLDKSEVIVLDDCDRVLAFGWLFMAALGVLLQYRLVGRCGDNSKEQLQAMKLDGRPGAPLRHGPREVLVVREYRSGSSGRNRSSNRGERRSSNSRSKHAVEEPQLNDEHLRDRLMAEGSSSSTADTSRRSKRSAKARTERRQRWNPLPPRSSSDDSGTG